jgi:hypothetical protein
MFADSIKYVAGDTIYYMNRIGVECTGGCPTLTTAINSTMTIIMANMPQFLQRKIKKLANGLVMLKDTATLVIKPNCQPGQTWLFDSINNKSAVCINKIGQSVFGISDSIKNILISGTDTLKLSKHFGILQFPNLYNKNKYYHLAGIENAATYDSIALYGLKVPNAWDFYNYNVGDKFCYDFNTFSHPLTTCSFGNFDVTAKVLLNDGYSYTVSGNTAPCFTSAANSPYSYTVYAYSNLSLPITENKMYPGQIIDGSGIVPLGGRAHNLVRFGVDNSGTFYKYAGKACDVFTNTTFPFNTNTYSDLGLFDYSTGYFDLSYSGGNFLYEIYGVGLGVIRKGAAGGWPPSISDWQDYCLKCAVKNKNLYSGTETFVSLAEEKIQSKLLKIFPNPTDGKIYLNMEGITANEVRIINPVGQIVFIAKEAFNIQNYEVDMSPRQAGIYFIQVFNQGKPVGIEKIIKN